MKRYSPLYLQNDEPEPTANLTPLIDVVFVLLIAFIFIMPVLNIDIVSLAESSKIEQRNIDSEIIIHVFSNNTFSLNNHKLSLEELPKTLMSKKYQSPSTKPILIQDKDSSFGIYQKIKSILDKTGFKEIHVVLSPEN